MRFKTKIAIKLPIPNWKETSEWGDYHMGLALKREFERRGCDVLLQTLSEWYNDEDNDCDVVIVLRGLSSYNTKKEHFNIMWNISHPDKVDLEEYNSYDHVFIASKIWAEKIREKANVPVDCLLQCTDHEVFYHDYKEECVNELLFVGNSRLVFRKIIKDLLPTDKDLSVYGTNWEPFIDKKYISGEHIPNNQLRKAYSSCEILLNDHWDDMREWGFLSNRLFDGFASGTFIISDKVNGALEVFGDALVTYESSGELKNLVDKYLKNDNARNEKALKGEEIVIKHHTFRNRVEDMLKVINSNISPREYIQNSDTEVSIDRLWKTVIFPIINKIQPKDMVEIGSELFLTKNILEYCQNNHAHLTRITSSLNHGLVSYKRDYKDYFNILTENSPIALSKLDYDTIFLDVDRTLPTIEDDLKIIEMNCKAKDFPIIFLHSIKRLDSGTSTEEKAENTKSNYYQLFDLIECYVKESGCSYISTEAFQGLIIIFPETKKLTIEDTFKGINWLRTLEEERQKFSVAYNDSKSLKDSLETKLIEKKIELEIQEDQIKIQEDQIKIQEDQIKIQEDQIKIQEDQRRIQEDKFNSIIRSNQQKLQNKEEQLVQTQIRFDNQLNISNKLSQEKDILKKTIVEKENQNKKLESQINNLSDDLFEIRYLRGKERPISQKLISKVPSLYFLFKMNKTGYKNSLINIKAYRSIKKNKLLDIGFYLRHNRDVQLSGQDPIIHYLLHGFEEGRKPRPDFDGNKPTKNQKDVKISFNDKVESKKSQKCIEEEILNGANLTAGELINEETIIMNEKEKKEKYKEIIDKNKSSMKLHSFKDSSPLVSIIISYNNSLSGLKRLFKNFKENVEYPSYEVIVIDNTSTNDSMSFLKKLKEILPLTIIKNIENNSYAKTHNNAVNNAKGEYILLLNANVEPTYGWLNQMVQTVLKSDDLGAVGAKLIYPDCSHSVHNQKNSFKIKHMGINFNNEPNGAIAPYNMGIGLKPFNTNSNSEELRMAVSGDALLVNKEKYLEVNGLDEGFTNGYEDVDLCLKLYKMGYKNIYSPKAVLFHYEC